MAGKSSAASATHRRLQDSGMLNKDQLLRLFSRFSSLLARPDVKKRIRDAVKGKQEAVAVTTAIQEEILLEMGIDPSFGIACLGKINTAYESDRDLMIRFYSFVSREEMACDEAELEPSDFAAKMRAQEKLHELQLEMLMTIRQFSPEEQMTVLEALHKQMESVHFDDGAAEAAFTPKQIEDVLGRRVVPSLATSG